METIFAQRVRYDELSHFPSARSSAPPCRIADTVADQDPSLLDMVIGPLMLPVALASLSVACLCDPDPEDFSTLSVLEARS
ncbi:hypothetical protein EF834_04005 [Rhodococcus spongiicola]|uniref:Uncharacterized protein n=1 Tax=Rhodococcus spongiicola TaxID=2487352 RepID=A0A438B6I6_9NOCA|nr:hypothetical protein EF834_04005 [Rhodococcus spongiicola]